MLFTAFFIFSSIYATTQAGVIRTSDLTNKNGLNTITNKTHNIWQPASGQRSDWLRCHGQPCDVASRILAKLKVVDQIEANVATGKQTILREVMQNKTMTEPELNTTECKILMTDEQATLALDNALVALRRQREATRSRRHRRKMENFKRWPFAKWSNPIRYKFDGKHSDNEKNLIRRAFKRWEEHTCVRFQELATNQKYDSNHILVTNQQDGCYSYVGRVNLIPQQLNLADVCLGEFGIAVHEVGHSLGLFHEQQRPDRDQYIQVLYKNINAYHSQFTVKHGADTGDVPYDMGSVMHYAGNAGSKDYYYLNTMQSLNPLFQRTMGQRVSLSFLDAKAINNRYCQAVCRPDSLQGKCQRGGYQDPNNCDRCRCPEGFGGRYCHEVQQSKGASCGGKQTLSSGEEAIITSPGYGPFGSYNDGTECNWLIQAPSDHRVELTFLSSFGVYCHRLSICFHWLEVRYGKDLGLPGPRLCCYQRPSPIRSETEEMALILRSDFKTEWSTVRVGFKARVKAVPKAGYTPKPTTKRTTMKTTTTTTTTTPRTTTTRRTTTTTTVPSTTTTTTPRTTTTTTPKATTTTTPRKTTTTTPRTTPTTTTTEPTTKKSTPVTTRTSTTTTSTTTTTTATTTTKQPTKPTKKPNTEATWGPWGGCMNSQCKCGGHSMQKRYVLCGKKRCTGRDEKIQERPCDRFCTESDVEWVYIGKLYQMPCSACSPSFRINGNAKKCTPR